MIRQLHHLPSLLLLVLLAVGQGVAQSSSSTTGTSPATTRQPTTRPTGQTSPSSRFTGQPSSRPTTTVRPVTYPAAGILPSVGPGAGSFANNTTPSTTRRPTGAGLPTAPVGQPGRAITTPKTNKTRKITRKFGTANQCEMLGFLGAELNRCGYCVGGLTELPPDFGVDCSGQCGHSYVDCAGQCFGTAYVDECSGQCIASSDVAVFIPEVVEPGQTPSGNGSDQEPQKYKQKEKETAEIVLPRSLDDSPGRIIARQLDNPIRGQQTVSSSAGGGGGAGLFGAAAPRPTVATILPRDCRGLCDVDRRPGTNFTFILDVCGICVIQYEPTHTAPSNNRTSAVTPPRNATASANATATTTTSGTTSGGTLRPQNKSKYKDCSGVCYAPGGKSNMAVNNSDTCFQCVGPQSRFPISEYKDLCGRCKKDNIPCPCPLNQQDMCGVCGGKNDSCTSVVKVEPAAVPSGNVTTVSVTGVALQTKYHVVCLLIRRDIQADGKDEEKFPARIRSSGITCDISAPEGSYKFHLAITQENGDVMSLSNNSVPFVVFNNQATFSKMSPTQLTVQDGSDKFTVRFAASNLQRIRTIYCLMEGEAWPQSVRVSSDIVSANEASCSLPFPKHSTIANVSVSIDGQHYVAGPFQLKFYAPMPYATDAYLLYEGNDIVIFFDRDMNISAARSCEDILTRESVLALGEGATCRWITRNQLIVSFGDAPVGKARIKRAVNETSSSSVSRETTLRFKDDVLFTVNETYTESTKNLSLTFSLVDEAPIVVLSGPRQVPSCGTFVLDGHQSIRTQSRRVRYKWDVTSSNPAAINQSLLDFLDEQTLNNSASFTLNVMALSMPDVDYTFTLTVYNGFDGRLDSANRTKARTNRTVTVRAPLVEGAPTPAGAGPGVGSIRTNRSASASLTVVRESHNVPIVMIEPSIANYPGAIPVDTRFTLTAHLSMPACQHEIYSINYKWSVDNPRVRFNMKQMNSKSYTVEPYSLPSGENVTFEVEATLNNDVNLTARAVLSFNVTQSWVRAILLGGYQRTAGNDSGVLKLNVSHSFHVDTPRMPLVYRWECFEEDNSPCYNYHPYANDTLLLPQPVTRDPVMTIRTNGLRPDSLLNFYVRAFSPINSSDISEARNVAIRVLNGSSPLVSINAIEVQDNTIQKPNMEDIIHLVPSLADIVVSATIEHNVPLANVTWSIPGFFFDLQPFAMLKTVNKSSRASLTIRKEHLIANGIYKVNATATNIFGESGWAVAAFTVLSPVSKCRIMVDDYEAFAMIEVRVEGCAASQHNYPLSYQAFIQDRANFISLNSPAFHLPLSVMGPPVLDENLTTPVNVFSVQVCDNLGSCWWFNSSAVRVKQVADFQAAGEHAFYMANIAKLQENYLSCLRRHALYLKAMAPKYRSKHEMEFESQMAEAFLCARRAADDQCDSPGCFANLFNFISYLPVESNPGRDFMLIEVVQKAINRLQKNNFTLTEYGAQQAFLVLEKIYRYNATNVEVSRLVRTMAEQIQYILARSLQPDDSPRVLDSTGHTAFAMKYGLLNDTFTVSFQPGGNKSAALSFSKDLREKYDTWQCDNGGRMCRGLVAELQFFPEHLYRPMEVDVNKSVSEIVRVVLLNPATGERLMTGEKAKTTLTLDVDPALMMSNLSYECRAWSEADREWSSDDVSTDITNSTVFSCYSKYLSTLAVIGYEPTLSAAVIAGIVVGVLLAIAAIAVAGFFIYKRARTKTMRVSISKGYHPNQ